MRDTIEQKFDIADVGKVIWKRGMVSKRFKHWVSVVDSRRCNKCEKLHGQIYYIDEKPPIKPPLHFNCRCEILRMIAIQAGLATKKGKEGADYWLKEYGELPDYYVTEEAAKEEGWVAEKRNFDLVLPGKMLAKGVYKNVNGHLPRALDRIWYEADINYEKGIRNSQRVLYSSDGLIFVTYDHYHTFYEIV